MSQLELKDLLAHLKVIGCIRATITTPEGICVDLVFDADPFLDLGEPKTPSGDDWS